MKKPLLLLFVSTLLASTAVGQPLPVKKKKPAPTATEATAPGKSGTPAMPAPGTDPASTAPTATNPALPKDFDPKITTDGRATDGQKSKTAGAPAPVDKNAKNLKPSNDAYEIGKTQLEAGDAKEALIYFDKAIKLYPNNFPALLLRGRAKVERKLYPEAMADLNRAAKGMADNPDVYFWRGRAKQEQDKDKEAVVDFTKALELKPDMGEAYYWRGHSYSEMDMLRESACPDFAKAAELGSELGAKSQKKYCATKGK
ncbi:MAG: tetratricopeptide repeat protein [Hymenobacteraceae bacterium]|nr:tetratricopeptide repeat protein [Hymenobacteraceae bacterium]